VFHGGFPEKLRQIIQDLSHVIYAIYF